MKKAIAGILIVFTAVHCPASKAFAGDAKYLEKGTPAPFTGYLIDQDTAEKVRIMDIDLEAQRRVNAIVNDENKLLYARVENANRAIEQMAKHSSNGFWNTTMYFFLGAAAASLVAFGASRSVR